ncbi:MAG TPA: hypothetical protein VFY71_04040 [Planctomycetota bacterium]|nr:hypothetical protein [Planctomycetota bacterium]
MSRHSLGRVRHALLFAAVLGAAGIATSAAPPATSSSPQSRAGAAKLVRDACALVEPVELPSSLAAAVSPGFKWKHRKLGAGSMPAIAASAAGEPHVVFQSEYNETTGERDLVHAWRVGSAWHSETIDAPFPAYIEDSTAVAIGSDGVLHVAYVTYDPTTYSGELRYARDAGAGWQIETVEAGGGSASIAVDEAGVPHILHLVGYPGDDVRYLTREPEGWTGEVIGDTSYPNFGSALRVHDSKVYAVYMDFNGLETLAIRDGGRWTTDVVASGNSCALAMDAEGRPHMAYIGWGNGFEVIHSVLTESGWTHETLVDETSLFGEPAPQGIAFEPYAPALTQDSAGRVRLAFGLGVWKGNAFDSVLTVAFLDEGAWVPSMAGKGRMGFGNSIAADAAGVVHVATTKITPGDPGKFSMHEYSLRGSKLSLKVVPEGSGTIVAAPLGVETTGKVGVSVLKGDTVTLTAAAGEGFAFSGWSGAISGADPTMELSMDHSHKVTAHFVPTEP